MSAYLARCCLLIEAMLPGRAAPYPPGSWAWAITDQPSVEYFRAGWHGRHELHPGPCPAAVCPVRPTAGVKGTPNAIRREGARIPGADPWAMRSRGLFP